MFCCYQVVAVMGLIALIYIGYRDRLWDDGTIVVDRLNIGDVIRRLYIGEDEYIRYYVCYVGLELDGEIVITVLPYNDLKSKSKNEQYYMVHDKIPSIGNKLHSLTVVKTRFKL
jgi:hypothetical protein